MPTPYPIFLNLAGRPCLIVGGGGVAHRKAVGLLSAGALVTVVSPAFAAEFATMKLTRLAQPYEAAHMTLARWTLAFAATDVPAVNAAVAADAAAARVFCARADAPDESDFTNGATGVVGEGGGEGRGGITLAVSTGHASPVLAARARDAAVAAIDPLLATWADLLGRWRDAALARVADPGARRDLLKRLAGPEMETALRAGGPAEAERVFAAWLAAASGA